MANDVQSVIAQLEQEAKAKRDENTSYTSQKMYKHAEQCFGQNVGMARAVELLKAEFGIE